MLERSLLIGLAFSLFDASLRGVSVFFGFAEKVNSLVSFPKCLFSLALNMWLTLALSKVS